MEDEFLKLTRVMEALQVDLRKQAIEDYKKSPGFEIGLVQMGRVSLEYGYQLALAQFRARYPDLEVEEDPFKLLPEVGLRRTDEAVSLRRELARKLSSNSLASESKEEMDDGLSRLSYIQVGPLRVVGKAQHNRASELSPSSSFDLTNSLWTWSSLWLTWRSCSFTESVESEEMMSMSGAMCITSREWLTDCAAGCSGLLTFLRLWGTIVPRCWVAFLGPVAIGAFLAGAPAKGLAVGVPLAVRVEECTGR
ncbi:hypothetical protein BHM03_00042035 [Ensete ventricosum]|nr:hypothetical protein BHM03_00042035 [Ensete ventricosum]